MAFEIPTEDSAVLSANGRYRYLVFRQIDGGNPLRSCCFVLLRPEGAEDNRAVRRCVDLARAFGVGEVLIVHAFALLAQDMADLANDGDPVGPDTDAWIASAARHAAARGGAVVCAWGANGSLLERDRTVLADLTDLGLTPACLGTDRLGFPLTPAKATGTPRAYGGRSDD